MKATATMRRQYDSPVVSIVLEEAVACFAGDKTPQDAAAIIQNRIQLYLDEQSRKPIAPLRMPGVRFF